MSFFDTTPIGRILNRFGKDIDVCDNQLPFNFRFIMIVISQMITTLIAISITTPIFIAVVVPLLGIYVCFLRFFVPTSRQLKRLDGVNRSPIYSHFAETIQGASTIRAFNKVDAFTQENDQRIDVATQIRTLGFGGSRWFGLRVELLGNIVTLSAAIFAATSQRFGFVSSAGLVGVSITYALNVKLQFYDE